jgi:hypothetical protein
VNREKGEYDSGFRIECWGITHDIVRYLAQWPAYGKEQ